MTSLGCPRDRGNKKEAAEHSRVWLMTDEAQRETGSSSVKSDQVDLGEWLETESTHNDKIVDVFKVKTAIILIILFKKEET